MNIAYGILNYNRDLDFHLLRAMPDLNNTIVCTNRIGKAIQFSKKPKHLLQATQSVAQSKNMIIDQALELKADYLYLMEDDIKITDSSIWTKYMILSKLLKYDALFAGFIGSRNKVLGGKLNPSLILDFNNHHFIINRNIGNGFTLLRLHSNMIKFNPDLINLENEFLVDDMFKQGSLPSNGFMPDIVDSHKHVHRINLPKVRYKNIDDNAKDMQKVGRIIEFDNDVDKFINYLGETIQ